MKSEITGYVEPVGKRVTIFLEDAMPIDSVQSDSVTGYFKFRDVPHGTYRLRARYEEYPSVTRFLSVYGHTSTGTIRLGPYPSYFRRSIPSDSSIIDKRFFLNNIYPDTTLNFTIQFTEKMDTLSLGNAITVTPQIHYSTQFWKDELVLTFSARDIFGHPEIKVTIDESARDGKLQKSGYNLHLFLFPDTSYYEEMISHEIFSSLFSTFPQTIRKHPLETLNFHFRNRMDRASVENAFDMDIESEKTFSWSINSRNEHVFSVRFAPILHYDTTYEVTFNEGYRSLDGTKTGENVSATVRTERMIIDPPTNPGEPQNQVVKLDEVIVLSCNFQPDPLSVVNALSVEPSLNYLKVIVSDKVIELFHSGFEPQTEYVISLDTSVRSVETAHQSTKSFSYHFRTGVEKHKLPQKSAAIVTVPADTTDYLSSGQPMRLLFPGSVHRANVESGISVYPALNYITSWRDTLFTENDATKRMRSILEINPVQPLKTNSLYRIELNSDNLGKGWIQNETVEFFFRTPLLRPVVYTPFDGSVNVAPNRNITVQFNAPIDTSSVLSLFSIDPPLESLHIDSYSKDEFMVTLGHNGFEELTEYTVSIENTFTDIYGVEMDRGFQWKFITSEY
ncbi:Ig-like domain-containing protein [Chitinispirillales bacterium ANBcel5]|uniref:Ig-like domain-containing protein n=1 Tax=Cellulosispirillum alkaliphilum TaxID=3039283 RepID=UPI002A56B24A|nr:Ig-like domain-containing protein [Chitinispirillales bacterium ANBcel5]